MNVLRILETLQCCERLEAPQEKYLSQPKTEPVRNEWRLGIILISCPVIAYLSRDVKFKR